MEFPPSVRGPDKLACLRSSKLVRWEQAARKAERQAKAQTKDEKYQSMRDRA